MTVKEMRDRRGQIATEMSELANNLTPENRTKFDLLDTEQKGLKDKIDCAERAAALETELRGTTRPPEAQPGDPAAAEQRVAKYSAAFRNYLKYGWSPRPDRGIVGISEEERALLTPRRKNVEVTSADMGEHRDMGSGGGAAYPGATTGFFVPVGFENRIEEALKYYGDMLNVAEIMTTASGQPLPFPTDNDVLAAGRQESALLFGNPHDSPGAR